MSTHGRDAGDSPDVTARVMQRLGYVNASAAHARQLRRRTAVVRLLQGLTVLSAIVLGAVWWFDGAMPAQRGPEVVESLRGSVSRGTSELHGFLAAMPRLPRVDDPSSLQGVQFDDRSHVETPSASLENSPQLRSY